MKQFLPEPPMPWPLIGLVLAALCVGFVVGSWISWPLGDDPSFDVVLAWMGVGFAVVAIIRERSRRANPRVRAEGFRDGAAREHERITAAFAAYRDQARRMALRLDKAYAVTLLDQIFDGLVSSGALDPSRIVQPPPPPPLPSHLALVHNEPDPKAGQ